MSETNSATAVSAPSFLTALIGGGLAGTSVDVALFPIDTIKTRLQAPQGFIQAGGLRGIYQGLGAAAAGSAPGAALFFGTYEFLKKRLAESDLIQNDATSHMLAASVGEAAACLVRVPTEVVKAKMQTASSANKMGLGDTIRLVLYKEQHGALGHVFGGLYRGYGITLMREIPFAMIQFPLYEQAKVWIGDYQKSPATPLQAAACGSASGALAAAVTTPLDVVKTRLMLGVDKHNVPYTSAMNVLQRVMSTEGGGVKTLFSGVQPRVMWISIGGFVFFGAYEGFKGLLTPILG